MKDAHKSAGFGRDGLRLTDGLLAHGYTLLNTTSSVQAICPPLCQVDAGTSLMGSDPRTDTWVDDNEQPQHEITLDGFQIAQFPVTNAEYSLFVNNGYRQPLQWHHLSRRPEHPVVGICWHDALAYAEWLSRVTGEHWRLPTEAQWEKAARWDAAKGHARIYPWGDTFDSLHANTEERSGKHDTTPVGAYPSGASPCGAQDMAGNVAEWTLSLGNSYPYVATDGREDPRTDGPRVVRGGNRWNLARYARCATRYWSLFHPTEPSLGVGYRLVRMSYEGP